MPNVSFRLLVSWINDEDLDTDHIDATKAFTQADVDKPIYVEAPEGFTVDNLKPSQSAYVLLIFKQGPRKDQSSKERRCGSGSAGAPF